LFQGLPQGVYHLTAGAPELGDSVRTAGPEGLIVLAEGEMRDGIDFGFARVPPSSTLGRDIEAPLSSPPEADLPDSPSGGFALQPWQIAAVIGSTLTLSGIVAAVAASRRRRARRPA
jgi:hypothetical protein